MAGWAATALVLDELLTGWVCEGYVIGLAAFIYIFVFQENGCSQAKC